MILFRNFLKVIKELAKEFPSRRTPIWRAAADKLELPHYPDQNVYQFLEDNDIVYDHIQAHFVCDLYDAEQRGIGWKRTLSELDDTSNESFGLDVHPDHHQPLRLDVDLEECLASDGYLYFGDGEEDEL